MLKASYTSSLRPKKKNLLHRETPETLMTEKKRKKKEKDLMGRDNGKVDDRSQKIDDTMC
jgi:hypothetical protein